MLKLPPQRDDRPHMLRSVPQDHSPVQMSVISPRYHLGFSPTSCKLEDPMASSHRLQMPVSTPRCHPYFWPASKTPSSGLINFLEWLTEPRQTVRFYLPVHHKRVGFRNSQTGETRGTGKGHRACVPPLNTLLFQTSVQSPTQKL